MPLYRLRGGNFMLLISKSLLMNKKALNTPTTKKPNVNTPLNSINNAVTQAFASQNPTHIQVAQQITTIFDPEVLQKYSQMVPDAPERVLAVFEKNSESERNIRDAMADQQRQVADIQRQALDYQAKDNQRRDWMAYSIILMGTGAAIAFTIMDKNIAAIGAFISVIAYTVAGFLNKNPKNSQETEK